MSLKENRTEELKIYLTPEEKEQIEEIADNKERSLSSLGRWKVLELVKPKVKA